VSSFLVFIFLSVAAVAQTPALNPTPVPVAQVAGQPKQDHSKGHYIDISAPEATLAACVITAFIVVAGWIVVHLLHRSREREARDWNTRHDKEAREYASASERAARRRDLLAILSDWERRFVVTDPATCKRLYYDDGMRALDAAAERFRADVGDKDEFTTLRNSMTDINPERLDARGQEQRVEVVCGAIRAFRDFIRNV
jgi:hypothetical protein